MQIHKTIYNNRRCSIGVEDQAHSLKDPVARVLVSLKVSLEDQTDTHCVSSHLGDIARGLESSAQLEFISLNGDDLNEWHFDDQFLRVLVI